MNDFIWKQKKKRVTIREIMLNEPHEIFMWFFNGLERLGQNKIVDMKYEQYFDLAKEIYEDSCQKKKLR